MKETSDVKLDWSPFSKGVAAETLGFQARKACLSAKAARLRTKAMETMLAADYGHPASSLGLAELFAVLYFGGVLNVSAACPFAEGRDRMVVSNGHVSAIVYATLAEAGFISDDDLKTYARTDGLPGHLTRFAPHGVEISSGSLGQGVSVAVGMAAALKPSGRRVFLLTSDGEQQEGQVWEAWQAAVKYGLSNLTVFIDCNGIQNSGRTAEVMPVGNAAKKFKAFGFRTVECDGNDVAAICDAFALTADADAPKAIILYTVPGKGVSFMENDPAWHGDLPSGSRAEEALRELRNKEREIKSWQSFLKEMAV